MRERRRASGRGRRGRARRRRGRSRWSSPASALLLASASVDTACLARRRRVDPTGPDATLVARHDVRPGDLRCAACPPSDGEHGRGRCVRADVQHLDAGGDPAPGRPSPTTLVAARAASPGSAPWLLGGVAVVAAIAVGGRARASGAPPRRSQVVSPRAEGRAAGARAAREAEHRPRRRSAARAAASSSPSAAAVARRS